MIWTLTMAFLSAILSRYAERVERPKASIILSRLSVVLFCLALFIGLCGKLMER